MVAACSQKHAKSPNALCGPNAEFVNVKDGFTKRNNWILMASFNENVF